MQTYLREAPTIASEAAFYLPLENARLAPVEVEDITAAFALLHGDGHEGKAYEITGPEALTMAKVADRLSSVLGKPVRYVNVAPEEKRQSLLAAGIPPAFADAMDELFSERRKRSAESTVNLSAHETLGVRTDHVPGVRPTERGRLPRRERTVPFLDVGLVVIRGRTPRVVTLRANNVAIRDGTTLGHDRLGGARPRP
jgi:hypothetical protein